MRTACESVVRRGRRAIVAVGLVIWASMAAGGWGAGRVELLLATEQGAPLVAQQTWMRELGQAGVQNVRIRAAHSGARPGIEIRGTSDRPVYVVSGTLTAEGDVVVPGGRFRDGQAARLARWLDDLARKGPPSPSEPAGAFGLSAQQNEQVRQTLARPVTASTKGQTPGQIVRRIRDTWSLPLELDATTAAALASGPIDCELSGMSCGTVLAYVLRGPGYCLVPRRSAGGAVGYAVVPAERAGEIWPVGHVPKTPRVKLVPKLYESRPIHIENVTVAQVLAAVAERVEIPVLVDHNALARHGLEPAKVVVSIPPGKTTYDKALNRVLVEAGLKRELRVDEAGKPFLWVTSLKPL